jgi:hypothetical protein
VVSPSLLLLDTGRSDGLDLLALSGDSVGLSANGLDFVTGVSADAGMDRCTGVSGMLDLGLLFFSGSGVA